MPRELQEPLDLPELKVPQVHKGIRVQLARQAHRAFRDRPERQVPQVPQELQVRRDPRERRVLGSIG